MKDPVTQLFNFLGRYNKPASSHSLGLFRVLFSGYLLLLISTVYQFRFLAFEQIPSIDKSIFPVILFLFIWTVSCIFLLFGLLTRYAALVQYICVIMITSMFVATGMGSFNDDLLRLGSLFCIFMPVSRSFSLDAIKEQLVYSSPAPKQTSYLNYLLTLFITLGLLYFPSGITKLCSSLWINGIGPWKPFSMPYQKWNVLPNMLVNQEWLMFGLNYFIIAWEISFVFLLFIPRIHKYLAISGILFHIGIGLFFSFPLLCAGPIVFYSLFIPSSFWDRLKEKLRSKRPVIVYVAQNHNAIRYWRLLKLLDFQSRFVQTTEANNTIELNSFQKFITLLKAYPVYIPFALFFQFGPVMLLLQLANRQWITSSFKEYHTFTTYRFRQMIFVYGCIFFVLVQSWILFHHCYGQLFSKSENGNVTPRTEYDLTRNPSRFLRIFLGVNSRGVFLDNSVSGKKKIHAITYVDSKGNEHWLPIFNERGYVNGRLNMDMAWGKVTFHLLNQGTNPVDSIGLKKFTWAWAERGHYSLDSLHLNVYSRTYIYPKKFEKDYYLTQEAIPWEKVGEIWWRKQVFSYYPTEKDTLR